MYTYVNHFFYLFSIYLSTYITLNILYLTSKLTTQHFCDEVGAQVGKETAPSPRSIDLWGSHAVFSVGGLELWGTFLRAHFLLGPPRTAVFNGWVNGHEESDKTNISEICLSVKPLTLYCRSLSHSLATRLSRFDPTWTYVTLGLAFWHILLNPVFQYIKNSIRCGPLRNWISSFRSRQESTYSTEAVIQL